MKPDSEIFRRAIARLNVLAKTGRRRTAEYRDTLKTAQDHNPNPRTPVGFYLD